MDIEVRVPSPGDPTPQARRPLNRPLMLRVSAGAFIREINAEPAVQSGLIRVVVRAFLVAALRGRDARTPDGWRLVIQDLRYVLGSALRDGVEYQRPVRPHDQPLRAASVMDADAADEQNLPVRLVHAFVRAYVAARMSGAEGATPEGRSQISGETRELVWDGMLDAVKQVPCPPVPRPRQPARAPHRIPSGE